MGDIFVFSADQVSRLTGLSRRQLGYWAQTGFFAPEKVREGDSGPLHKVYSFRDVVGLGTIALIRDKVPLQRLREVAGRISHYEGPWAGLTFWVGGRQVFWTNPDTNVIEGSRPPRQSALPIEMQKVEADMHARVETAKSRGTGDIGAIYRHRTVAENAYVVAGTRIPTAAIYAFHLDGYDTDAIIREYPRLTPTDVVKAIEWEAQRKQSKAS